jgi:hypothetical protein
MDFAFQGLCGQMTAAEHKVDKLLLKVSHGALFM